MTYANGTGEELSHEDAIDLLYGPEKKKDEVAQTTQEKIQQPEARTDDKLEQLLGKPNGGVVHGKETDAGESNGLVLSMDRPNIAAVLAMEMRMSAIGICQRRLGYEAAETPESDEIPSRNRALMEMGKLLEPVVKQMMRQDGWVITDEEAVELAHGRFVLTGHPDGIARHPELSGGKMAVLEVKTRSGDAARYAWDMGVERSHPEAVWQAALYSYALFGKAEDVVIATMDRDSAEYRAERIPTQRVEQAYLTAMKRVNDMGRMIRTETLAPPEYPAGHWKCESCPFRSICGNHIAPDAENGDGALTADELVQQVSVWAEANASAARSSSPASKAKKAAADTIKTHMIATLNYEDEVAINGQKYSLKLSEKPDVAINLEAFNELVAPEIREQVVEPTVRRSMRITPVKAKKEPKAKARGNTEHDGSK